jgi:4'-phosphopantetheinyl transferase EntD
MITSDLLEAWRALLPPCVKVSAGPLLNHAAALTFTEHASAGIVDGERLRELRSGRVYAKAALSMLGIDNAELPIGPDRAPIWPNGVVGSITHARDAGGSHVAAAVGRACDVHAIGIDVECDRSPQPDTWAIFLTERELKRIFTLPARSRGLEVLNVWCVKEAGTKALRRTINPTEIETDYDQNRDEYLITLKSALGDSSQYARTLRGRTKRLLGFVMATATSNCAEA